MTREDHVMSSRKLHSDERGIALVLVMSWLSRRSLEQPDETAANTAGTAIAR